MTRERYVSKALSLGLLLALAAATARAQIALPPARVPGLPGTALPGTALPGTGLTAPGALGGGIGLGGAIGTRIERAGAGVRGAADPGQLTGLRRERIAALIRRYPRLIERDPRGDAIARGVLVAYAPSDSALDRARAFGFVIVADRTLDGLGARVVVLRAPERLSTQRALDALRALDPAGTYDFNHLYSESGEPSSVAETAERPAPPGAAVAQHGSFETRVGLIDSGVDAHHPVFADVSVHLHGCMGRSIPAEHGTEVASLLVGRSAHFHGAAPGAALFGADVYCGVPTGGTVESIADAFDWLVHERVPVINVSLVGPPNALLAAVVRSVVARGYLIVAAVGNDGPAAPPLYPAAYPGVIGVTGVDARGHILAEAERGEQVKFAAPGADMSAALPPRAYAEVRGTSFAAPIVAGLLARSIAAPDPLAAARALESLERRAIDLGAPGIDHVYGYGLVGGDLRPEPALARSQ